MFLYLPLSLIEQMGPPWVVALMPPPQCPLTDSQQSLLSPRPPFIHIYCYSVQHPLPFSFPSSIIPSHCVASSSARIPALRLSLERDVDGVQRVSSHRSAFLVKSLVMWFTIYLTSAERRQAGELNQRRREITHSPLHGNASNLTSHLHCKSHTMKRSTNAHSHAQ